MYGAGQHLARQGIAVDDHAFAHRGELRIHSRHARIERRQHALHPAAGEVPQARLPDVAEGIGAESRIRAPCECDQFACTAGVRISRGRMIAAAIASRHSAAKACSIIVKPPWSYSHATRPTEAPAAVKPTK